MRAAATLLFLSILAGLASAQTGRKLDIYLVDVEGGNAVLFVSPTLESLLMDTGNVGAVAAPRDAGRIVDAMKDAGVSQIDHLITTHWHSDHFGGMEELAKRVTIKEYIDHGPNVQPGEAADNFLNNVYPKLIANAKHTVAKPGDRIAMGGLDVRVVTSANEVIKAPLPGAGKPNPYCSDFKAGDANKEDPMSVGIHVTFGKFRTIHVGDIAKQGEFNLVCPTNRIGTVDLLLGLHHGVGSSNSPVFVHALHPRVAIMNNGTRKGGRPGYDEDGLLLAWPRRLVGDAFLAAQRPGVQCARTLHRERGGRPAGQHADCADFRTPAGTECGARTGAQREGLLD
jgi:competence protein ComEC